MNRKQAILTLLLGVLCLRCGSQEKFARDPNARVTFHGGTGSQLLRQCQGAIRVANGQKITGIQEATDISYCRGYVYGVVDQMVGLSVHSDTVYCVPATAENDQLVRVVVKYLIDHPNTLNYPAGALVASAMIDAFPCKSTVGGQD